MSHTPAPWKPAMNGRITGHFRPENPDGGFHADICRVELEHSDKSGPHNFNLILASPELREACLNLLDYVELVSFSLGSATPAIDRAKEALDTGRAAIAKARGEEA